MVRVGRRVGLTVAGVDSGGGAGIVADLKTFQAHGLWAAAAVTAVTAQNTLGVQAVEAVSPELVRAQIASVAADLGVDAAKTGMLGSADVVRSVTTTVEEFGVGPLVVDPVLASSAGGTRLLDDEGLDALRRLLLPLAAVVTPNLAEASALTGLEVGDPPGMEAAARALVEMGPAAVLVTGGHLGGDRSPDLLLVVGEAPRWLDGERVPGGGAHGSGCVLSAAVCAGLARGMGPADACVAAKRFVERALAAAVGLGAGSPSIDPGAAAGDLRGNC